MTDARACRGRRCPAEVISWAVRRSPWFPLGSRDLERMLADRGVAVDHTTLDRWIQRFAPELERRLRRHLRPCRGPWHVDRSRPPGLGRFFGHHHLPRGWRRAPHNRHSPDI